MANYRRTGTGNWSTLAQWQDDGGGSYVASTVLPGATDVVYANNFTVTLDIDVVVLELRTNSALNVNAGGLFDFGAANSVTANCFAGNSICVRNNTANAKTITGNLVGGTGTFNNGAQNSSSGTLTVNGNSTGGTGGNAAGAQNSSTGNYILNGTATGGSGADADGALNFSTGSFIVNGIAIAGTNASGARNTTTGTMRITTAQGGDNAAAVNAANVAGTTIVENLVWPTNGRIPVTGFVKFNNTAAKSVQVTLENNTTVTLVDNSVPNYPLEADVEQGVGYGPANIYTGTLVASISPQDIFTAIANSTDPIAVRLRNVSTVATTAATVASFDV